MTHPTPLAHTNNQTKDRDRSKKGEMESSVVGKKENRATHETAEVLGSATVRMAETLLRIMPMGLCLAALVVMLNNRQTNDFGSISYSDIGGFRYLVYANGVCAGYSLLSAFYTAIPRPTTIPRPWTIFFFDQVLTYVVLAAGTVSAELVYLAHKGDEKIAWSAACGVYGGFCRKAVASVGITFGTVLCYIALSLISSYRLFSTYDSPVCSSGKSVEIAAFPG